MNDFVYKFYDFNQDNEVSIVDILQANTKVSPYCQFGMEIDYLVDNYIDKVVKPK